MGILWDLCIYIIQMYVVCLRDIKFCSLSTHIICFSVYFYAWIQTTQAGPDSHHHDNRATKQPIKTL